MFRCHQEKKWFLSNSDSNYGRTECSLFSRSSARLSTANANSRANLGSLERCWSLVSGLRELSTSIHRLEPITTPEQSSKITEAWQSVARYHDRIQSYLHEMADTADVKDTIEAVFAVKSRLNEVYEVMFKHTKRTNAALMDFKRRTTSMPLTKRNVARLFQAGGGSKSVIRGEGVFVLELKLRLGEDGQHGEVGDSNDDEYCQVTMSGNSYDTVVISNPLSIVPLP